MPEMILVFTVGLAAMKRPLEIVASRELCVLELDYGICFHIKRLSLCEPK